MLAAKTNIKARLWRRSRSLWRVPVVARDVIDDSGASESIRASSRRTSRRATAIRDHER